MKNMACFRLGTMLYLDIQEGKEDSKTSEFQKYLGGTAACMKRLEMCTKGCVQLTSTDTYFADSWFSSIKTAEEAMAAGVDYCGPAKTSQKGFCLDTLENLTNDWLGGSYLDLKSTPRVTCGIPLLVIGNKYNYRKVIVFIATEGGGNTEPGDPYLSCFPEIYSNVSVFPVVFPHLLGRYFNSYNTIDNQNMMWQSNLALDKD